MRAGRAAAADALRLAALWAFAVAAPLLDTLGRGAEFFVAHRARPVQIVALAALIALAAPALLALLLAALPLRVRAAARALVSGALVGAVALRAAQGLSPAPALVAAALAGALGAALLRLRPVRSFLTVLAPAALLIPALFLLHSPVARLVGPALRTGAWTAGPTGDAPVVVVVFDEFPLASLLDAHGGLDTERLPGFGALAGDATWYRNATAVAPNTSVAVPALLTGRSPSPGRLPTLADHAENLFTWLAPERELNVHEPVTHLCPATSAPAPAPTLRALLDDAAVVLGHGLLPRAWAARLPSLRDGWHGFRARPPAAQRPGVLWHDGRREQLEAFLASIGGAARPALHFLHVLLPHVPWEFLPSGKRYHLKGVELAGWERATERWDDDEELVAAAERRHLLQVGTVDRFVGRLVERLRETGLWDRAVVVVTADHGAGFRPGASRRDLDPEHPADVLAVPLFVKRPGQRGAAVSDRNVEAIDVLPTIAEGLGVALPFRVDGAPAGSGPARPRKAACTTDGRRIEFPSPLPDRTEPLERRLRREAGRPPWIGRPLAGLAPGVLPGFTAEIEEADELASVRLSGDYVPALVTGRVRMPDGPADGRLEVALAVDGVVRAAGPARREADGSFRFAVVLPEEALREGRNDVEALVAVGGRLRRAAAASGPRFRLEGDGIVRVADGARAPLDPARGARGGLDWVRRDGESVRMTGWAADLVAQQPADAVLAFLDGRLVGEARPAPERRGIKNVIEHRFTLAIPLARLAGGAEAQLRVFAWCAAGGAAELEAPVGTITPPASSAPVPLR